LPDGIFSNRKSEFGQILEGLEMENFGIRPFIILYGHLVIWYIFPILGCFIKKNLATLMLPSNSRSATLRGFKMLRDEKLAAAAALFRSTFLQYNYHCLNISFFREKSRKNSIAQNFFFKLGMTKT
jgi:hypothetical protein